MAEFTGERLVPGEVDPDLYNEHLARYRFVRRLSVAGRILDAGCGVGYGTAVLSQSSALTVGFDNDLSTIREAVSAYANPGTQFLVADVHHPPFQPGTFDCAVSFEVIEHLHEPEPLVAGLRNVTKPNGLVVLSTPNRELYELSRGNAGPNPFHHHEFTHAEFGALLRQHFIHVTLFAQNHTPTISFRSTEPGQMMDAEPSSATSAIELQDAQFFVAVCSHHPLPRINDFVLAASTGNVLFAREEHIRLLENELDLKNTWLAKAGNDLHSLLHAHQQLQADHEERLRWAEEANRQHAQAAAKLQDLQSQLNERSAWAMETIQDLQSQLNERSAWAMDTISALEETGQQLAEQLEQKCLELQAAVDQLHATEALLAERTTWATTTIPRLEQTNAELALALTEKCHELQEAITFLHQAEETIAERTKWAQSLNQQVTMLEEQVATLQHARKSFFGWLPHRLRPHTWLRSIGQFANRLFRRSPARKP